VATAAGAMTEPPVIPPARPNTPETADHPQRNLRVARGTHPLLGAFPLTVMTLATFLAIFALMMARLTAGADPALRPRASTPLVAEGAGRAAVTTRASGTGASSGTVTPVAAPEQPASGTTAAVVTRASGAPGAAGASDD
jgi:hypothetical protein